MLLGDLLSARQLELPVKVVVYNNSSLGFVAMEMKAGGYLDNGSTDLQATDFAAIAEGAGIRGTRVTESEALPEAIERFLAYPGPAVLDVVTNRHELALPPKVEWAHAKGFSLYLLRAVLNGRGDEVIELTQTNLLR
jgi:pyruvate dehydrogenase (quinone)